MDRIIKEIIIMLLVCIAVVLTFAIVLYKYIPARKNVEEIVTYSETKETSEMLGDNIDKEDSKVVLSVDKGKYKITASDLNEFEEEDKFEKGKDNPFVPYSVKDEENTGNTSQTTNQVNNENVVNGDGTDTTVQNDEVENNIK